MGKEGALLPLLCAAGLDVAFPHGGGGLVGDEARGDLPPHVAKHLSNNHVKEPQFFLPSFREYIPDSFWASRKICPATITC